MTLSRFQYLLRRIDPRLRIRQRFSLAGSVGGIFVGLSGKSGYIARVTLGEMQVEGYRYQLIDPTNKMEYQPGLIRGRGRKTLIKLLRSWRWLKNHKQRSMLLFGIEPKENIEIASKRVLLHG